MKVETDSRFQLTFCDDSEVEKCVAEYLLELPTNQRSIEARQLALDGFRLVTELMEANDRMAFNVALIELSDALGLDGDEIRQYLGLPACVMRQRIDIKDIIDNQRATRILTKNQAPSSLDFTKNEGESGQKTTDSIDPAYGSQNELEQQGREVTFEDTASTNEDKSINKKMSNDLQNDLIKLVAW